MGLLGFTANKDSVSHRLTMTIKKPFNSVQFNNQLIVNTYNLHNPITEYKDFFLDFANSVGAEVIVDVGCGTGLLTCALAEQGFKLIGVEPAQPMLEIAQQNNCLKVDWVHGLAKDLVDYRADMVIMTGHVAQFHLTNQDWSEALDGIYRTLKIGGYLIFESRNPSVRFWETGKAEVDWQSSKDKPNIINDEVYGEIRSWFEFISFTENRLEYNLHYDFVKENKTFISHDILRYRSYQELSESLLQKRFKVENVYGFWDKRSVTADSPELIFVAKKQ